MLKLIERSLLELKLKSQMKKKKREKLSDALHERSPTYALNC